MKLVGRIELGFEKWFTSKYGEVLNDFYISDKPTQYGIYIDFFNTKKYKGVRFFDYVFEKSYEIKTEEMTVNDVLETSIIRCNDFYNLLKDTK